MMQSKGLSDNKINVLWLSMMAPYDSVPHAGGKTENYYLKELNKQEKIDIVLCSTCKPEEVEKIDLENYGIKSFIEVRKRKGVKGTFLKAYSWISKSFIWNDYCGLTPWDISNGIKKSMLKAQKELAKPDIIIVQWTEILFLLEYIKKLWIDVPVIAIEEDLSFLGQKRKLERAKTIFSKKFYKKKFERVKKNEIKLLNECDYVIFSNSKDERMARECGLVTKSWAWSAYYQPFRNIEVHNQDNNKIVFYGAMFREENWRSAIWFIENVMPLLDKNIVFEIVGSNPNKKLLKYRKENVVIKGYVEDIGEELASAKCIVAPLLMGAGIKVKVLEAMTIGIPVATNEIGIEGISAENGTDFFLCKSPSDYKNAIEMICSGIVDVKNVGRRSKLIIKEQFNYTKDKDLFIDKVIEIVNETNEKQND